jgi:hypothetical protein
MAFGDHVKVKLGLDSKGFNQGLSNAQAKAQKFGSSFKSGFVGAIGTAVIVQASKQIIDFGASIGDLADRLGVSAEFLQKMQFSAEQNGSSVKEADKAVTRLAKSIGDAKDGLSTAVRAFDRAGVTFKNTDGSIKSIEQVTYDLADGLKNMTDDGERVKVAFDLMGRSGLAMTQFMNGGSDAMKSFGERAEQLGFILSNDNVKALQDASGELEKLGRQTKVFGAKILPPLFARFKQFVDGLQRGIEIMKPFGSAILAVGKALATYWVTAKLIGAGQIIVGGFIAITKAVQATTLAVASLNLASAKNPFGLLMAGAVLLYPLVKKLVGATEEYNRALEKNRADKISALKEKTRDLAEATRGALEQFNDLQDEIEELKDKGLPDYSKQVEDLSSQVEQLKEIEKLEGKRLQRNQENLRSQEKYLEGLLAQRKSGVENQKLEEKIEKQNRYIATLQKDIADGKFQISRATRDQLILNRELTDAEMNLKNETYARANGLEKLLEKRSQESINLERTLAKTEALRKGDEEQVKTLDRKFAIEDKTLQILKDKSISLEEAFKLATKLVDAKNEEKRLEEQIKQEQADKAKLTEEERKEHERKLDQLKQEKALHLENRKQAEQDLAILRLKARGQNDLALLLEARINNEKKLQDIQKLQGLNLAGAVAQRRQELLLIAKAQALEVARNKDQVLEDAVARQAGKDLKGADRDEKKRIRNAKDIERIDKRIEAIRKRGGIFAEKEIKELQAIRAKKLALVIDDQAKKELKEVEKQKLEFKKNFEMQKKAIELAEKELQNNKAQAEAQVKAQGDAEEERVKSIWKTERLAFEKLAETYLKKLQQIKAPAININPANAMPQKANGDPQKVVVENQLSQATQNEILRTLKGYFINQ